MKQWIKKMGQFGGLISLLSCSQPTDVITIDLSQEGAEIPSSLYGIFFEEITHSGDGGLYAEMIRRWNVTFRYSTTRRKSRCKALTLLL